MRNVYIQPMLCGCLWGLRSENEAQELFNTGQKFCRSHIALSHECFRTLGCWSANFKTSLDACMFEHFVELQSKGLAYHFSLYGLHFMRLRHFSFSVHDPEPIHTNNFETWKNTALVMSSLRQWATSVCPFCTTVP